MRFGKRWMAFSLIAVMVAAKLSTPLTPMTAMADEIVFVEDSQTNVEGSFFVEDVPEETVAANAVYSAEEMPEIASEDWTEEAATEIPSMNAVGKEGSIDIVDTTVDGSVDSGDIYAEEIPMDSEDTESNIGEAPVETVEQFSKEASQKTENVDINQEISDPYALPEETGKQTELIEQEDIAGLDEEESVDESTDEEEEQQKSSSSYSSDISVTEQVDETEQNAGQNESINGNDSMTTLDPNDSAGTEGEIFYTDLDDNEGSSSAVPSSQQVTEGETAISDGNVAIDSDELDYLNKNLTDEGDFFVDADITEIFSPVENGITEVDNDEAFASYVNKEMGLTEQVQFVTDTDVIKTPRLKSNYALNRLTGANRSLYGILLSGFRKIASGERASTVFEIGLDELGIESIYWSKEDFDVDSVLVYDENNKKKILSDKVKQSIYSALKETYGIDYTLLNKTLLADCPYELYWFDKVKGLSYSPGLAYYTDGSGVLFKGPIRLSFSVCDSYRGNETYSVNTQIGQSVQNAHENAVNIVDANKGKADFWKLDAYRESIRSLTTYNSAAANDSSTPYGDPWQLIYVFDGDENTTVVCEGYAKAFQYLCDLSSFNSIFKECISVSGSMDGEPHMWNIVALKDNKSYLVDITNTGDGRDLFLVGTGDVSSPEIYAYGDVNNGYTFPKKHSLKYEYDEGTFNAFDIQILTLAEGRVSENTSVEYISTDVHTHLYIPISEQRATITQEGHSSGTQCVLCGVYDDTVVIYPKLKMQSLIATDISINYGDRRKISVSGAVGGLSFESSNTNIATVDQNGNIKGEKAGSAKITITASETEDYGETSKDITVTVKPLTIATGNVSLDASAQTYDGTEKKPAVTVKSGSVTFKSGTDYTVAYSNNTNAGTATVKVTGKGSCTGTVSKTFPIAAAKLTADSVTVATGTYTYNGKQHAPAVTVKYGNATLKKEADYSLTYANNINAGTAKVTVEGKGNYTGKVTKTYTIAPTAQTITAKAAASSIAVGKTTTISISGAKGTKTFKSSNTAIATVSETGKVTAKKVGTVKITAASAKTQNYKASSKTVTLKILPGRTSAVNAVNQTKGIKLTWAEVAGANGYIIYRNDKKVKTITKGTTVTWADTAANTNGTKYVYKVVAKASTGISPLSRTWTTYRMSRPALKTLKNSDSKKMKVTWAKNAKSTGYQIQYALNSKFTSGLKKVSITKAATVTRVIKSLIKGKTYYVRIRTVKKVGNHAYYSVWSPVKALKISK